MPAAHPGARPPAGGRIVPAGRPLRVSSHEITEFEFHISPVPSSSRPQTGVGSDPTRSRRRRARTGSSLSSRGLATAWSASPMTPSRQRRTSYRNARQRASRRLKTGPWTTTPRRVPSATGIGQEFSITKRPSGTRTTRAEWYRSRGRLRSSGARTAS
jgi:hypothetical protein